MLNKPINMVSQFISSHAVNLLGDLNVDFPEGTHAIGRLDNNSEGLLLLTTNKKVTRLLFLGPVPHKRTYLVQVNNLLSDEKLAKLQNGINIKIKEGANYTTPPCEVAIVPHPEQLYAGAVTPAEFGQHTWLTITITEGKYHQVRKMIGAIHHRCKRLIRLSIEDIALDGLAPGEIREMDEQSFFKKLYIDYVPQD